MKLHDIAAGLGFALFVTVAITGAWFFTEWLCELSSPTRIPESSEVRIIETGGHRLAVIHTYNGVAITEVTEASRVKP